MEEALQKLRADISTCETLENTLRGKPLSGIIKQRTARAVKKARENGTVCKTPVTVERPCTGAAARKVDDVLQTCLAVCKEARKRHRETTPEEPMDDHSLSQHTRFTDQMNLKPFEKFLHYVPRLVNVVTVRFAHESGPARRARRRPPR
jgi:hypothetical protein